MNDPSNPPANPIKRHKTGRYEILGDEEMKRKIAIERDRGNYWHVVACFAMTLLASTWSALISAAVIWLLTKR